MKWLFNNTIKHLPEKRIDIRNRIYLGFADSYDVWLVIEEWQFRIYSYEYRDYDTIDNNHADEDWRAECWHYIADAEGCMDMDTCEYSVPEFEWNTAEEIARELLLACRGSLELAGWLSNGAAQPTYRLIDFIEMWMSYVENYKNSIVYCYYK